MRSFNLMVTSYVMFVILKNKISYPGIYTETTVIWTQLIIYTHLVLWLFLTILGGYAARDHSKRDTNFVSTKLKLDFGFQAVRARTTVRFSKIFQLENQKVSMKEP